MSWTTAGRCAGQRNASRPAARPRPAERTVTGSWAPRACTTVSAVRTTIPRRAPAAVEPRVVHLRREHRTGPARPAARAGVASSTAYRILRRHGLPAPAVPDRATGNPVDVDATNAPAPASRSTSTSKSPAASPTAAATRSSATRRVAPTGSRPWQATSAFLPHPRHGLVRRPGHQPSLDPALAAADQRQGERSHRTCSRNGPTSGPTPQRPNGRQRFLTGWTGTTTTGPAPASTARPQPATSPTCPDNTPRAGCHRQATPALRTATTPLCHGVTLCFCSPGPCPDGPTGQPACLPGVASPPPHPAPGSLRFAT